MPSAGDLLHGAQSGTEHIRAERLRHHTAVEIIRRNLGERRRPELVGILGKKRTDPLEAPDSYRIRAESRAVQKLEAVRNDHEGSPSSPPGQEQHVPEL